MTSIRSPASAVPEKIRLWAVVTPSWLVPVSGLMPVIAGAGGGCVSMTIVRVEELALVVPAMSMAVAVTLYVPSGNPGEETVLVTRPTTEPSSEPTAPRSP